MGRPKHVWSEEQIAELKRLWPDHFLCDVADMMGIGQDRVRRKAIELDLKKSPDFDPHSHYGRYTKKGNHFNN